MVELNTLRYFSSAFETGTFSKAARLNGVSQPTVSAAILKLEDRLGMPLFQRSKSGLVPTALARKLYYDTVDSVSHLSTLESRLRDQPQKIVRIHCAPDMLIHGLAPGLHSLRRSIANLTFRFTEDPDDCDLAYVSDKCVPSTHEFIPTADEAFRIAVARFHPFAGMSGIRLADLQGEPLIHRPYCPNADRMDLATIQTSAAAQAMNDPQLLDLVAAGLGIAFVPQSHGDSRENIIVRPLIDADAGSRRIGVSHRKSAFSANLAERLTTIAPSQNLENPI
ncbi:MULTISPECIES: LysR family transcriptional regulator [Falsihalocynthiibacter]|uniref:LysR family transcriptional regulator n=1 Tax=Falsihalocynthiibacter TaxID=2854182 RepID=UPI00300166C8